jgi:Ca2+-binding RTX toxin-like protein
MCCVLACGFGCDAVPEAAPHRPIEGIDELSQPLSDLSAQCVFTPATRVLVLTLDAGDIAVFARASNQAITVNALPCGAATATTVQRIDVREGVAGDQTVIFDYGGGTFAPGITGAAGVTVDLGGSSDVDAVKLIGSTGADGFVIGSGGIAINNDGFLDYTLGNIETLVVSFDDGADTFSAAGNAVTGAAASIAVTVYGGNGNDTLRGGNGDDTLYGGAGDDALTTGATIDGNDALHGGADTDTADYAARTAAITVTLDDVADDGGAGEIDNVATDIEILKGGQGDDHLTGSAGANTISGGLGGDTLGGGAGAGLDVLNGDAGDDTFDQGLANDGPDIVNGGAGSDTASYAGRSIAVAVVLDAVATDGQAGELDKIMLDVENVTGGAGNDELTGSTLDNVLEGGIGNDTLSGGAGNDTLRGGADTDALNGDAGNDTFDEAADTGNDTLTGGAGTDTVDYTARGADLIVVMDGTTACGEPLEADRIATDIENLIGGGGTDQLTGNASDNQLEGGPGTADDTLRGLAGDDLLDGGSGDDVIDCGAGDADINLDQTSSSEIGCEL